jgi:DNA-directed RNA polymerase subunit K/omega
MNYRDVDDAVHLVGGRFAFAVLLQKRVRELVRGARPLCPPGRTHIDTALAELRAGKIKLVEAPEPTPEELAEAEAAEAAAAAAAAEAEKTPKTADSPAAGGGIL